MRDAACEAADGFHLVRLAQSLFESFLFELRFLNSRTHAVERFGDFSDFVAGSDFKRIREIAAFERVHATDKIFERTGKRTGDEEYEDTAAEHAEATESNKDA